MKPPLISVVTPSLNQAEYLERTLQSVADQDYPHVEHLVIDGGSTDGSVEILERWSDRLARWVSEPDRGQSHAINKGLRWATGDVVAYINSDDYYLPGAFAAAAVAFETRLRAGSRVAAATSTTTALSWRSSSPSLRGCRDGQ